MGKYAEIDILLQPESASERCISFEELVRPGSILLAKYAEIDILLLLQLESASECYIAFEGLVWPRSILMGRHAKINTFLQPQSASECYIAFTELVRPESTLLGKYAEIDIFLRPKSRAVEFRTPSIREFRIPPFLVLPFTNRVKRPSVQEFAIRR